MKLIVTFHFLRFQVLSEYLKMVGSMKASTIATMTVLPKMNDLLNLSLRNSKNVQHLLRSRKHFDVILVESVFCVELMGIGHHFNAPIILISPMMVSIGMHSLTASPALKSFMPNIHNSYTNRMSFWQRMHNMLTYITFDYFIGTLTAAHFQKSYEHLFSIESNAPSIHDLMRNVSLILLNSHANMTSSKPFMPHIIEIGGLTIDTQNQTLPQDIQAFLDSVTTGAVYFSIGSVLDVKQIQYSTKIAILNAFKAMPTVKFIVKGDDDLRQLAQNASNILVRSWLPQQALLKHSSVKCFVTHGGMNSIQESIHNGIPVVVIPFYHEQLINARWAQENGYGIEIPSDELAHHRLQSAVQRILLDERCILKTFPTSIFLTIFCIIEEVYMLCESLGIS